SRRELAEGIWTISHQNILEFLSRVEAERQYRVKFEDLVREPSRVMEGVSRFLGLEFEPGMLEPYGEGKERMTDAVHPLSVMVGDVKFHEYGGIEKEVAERWRKEGVEIELGSETRELAARLGYAPADRGREKVTKDQHTSDNLDPMVRQKNISRSWSPLV